MMNIVRVKYLALIFLFYLCSFSLSAVQASHQKVIPSSHEFQSLERSIATGTTTRISITPEGIEGNNFSDNPSISADGRYVAFCSSADNLVLDDSHPGFDIFVVDTQSGILDLVSVSSDGTQGNGWSQSPSISGDGRYVVFTSSADNLVNDDTNRSNDIFLHDRQTGSTKRISVASDGTQADDYSGSPTISANGNFVVFTSDAVNLVPGLDERFGRIFIHNTGTGETELISIDYEGNPAYGQNPTISADGTRIAFASGEANLVPEETYWSHIFVRDRVAGQTFRVSLASDGTPADDESRYPAISGDGRYVAFESMAANLIPDDNSHSRDVFIHDTLTGITSLVSMDSIGTKGNDWSTQPSLSEDGRYVTFSSRADNLVPDDTNENWDTFIHDRSNGVTARISVSTLGTQTSLSGGSPNERSPISSNGQFAVFSSYGTELVDCGPPVTNESFDVYIRDLDGELSTITGTVNTTSNGPLSEVRITANNLITETDSFGDYAINGLCPGEFTVSASLWGYDFSPSSRLISVPPHAANQDFIGQPLTYSFLPSISQTYCKIAYYDSFEDPASGWPVYESENVLYDYDSGEYKIVLKNPNWWGLVRPDFSAVNFDLGVQVRNANQKPGSYGLAFNIAEDWSHLYTFEIDSYGFFSIWRYSDAKGWKLLLENYSPLINTGSGVNELEVKRTGALIDIFANGHQLASISDSTFTGLHRMGLISTSYDQGYLDIRFDNFYITPDECSGTSLLSTQKLSGSKPGNPDFTVREGSKFLK